MSKSLASLLLLLGFTACSVASAYKGTEEPDVSVLEIGATRAQIELHLAHPVSSIPNASGGTTEQYQFIAGHHPSLGRAAGYAVMDLFSFGLWELMGTEVEKKRGRRVTYEVEYDDNDYATSIRKSVVELEPERRK